MSVEFYRESPGKFDSRTLDRKTLNRWTGRTIKATTTATKRLRRCSSRLFEQLFELFSVVSLFSSKLFELIRVVVILL